MSSKAIPKLDKLSLSRQQVQIVLKKEKSLIGCDLRGLDLSGLCFDDANLKSCKLAEANLSECSFNGANLTKASLWKANLKNAKLDNAVLTEADLEWSNLDGCSFFGAQIARAILPLQYVTLEQLHESISSGKKIVIRKTTNGTAKQ